MERLGSHWTDFHEIWVFRKPAEKIQVSLKCDKNSGCFTRRSLSFMTTLSWILFKMRYVSGKSCIESQNTHLCPKPFFFICAFYEMHCLSISLLLRFWLWNRKHLSQLFILLWGGMYLWFLLWSVHALHSIACFCKGGNGLNSCLTHRWGHATVLREEKLYTIVVAIVAGKRPFLGLCHR